MAIKRLLGAIVLVAGIFTADMASGAAAVGKTFPTLTIGSTTYTNATITDVSRGTIFLRHSRGFESLRTGSLDAKTLGELGIQAPGPDKIRRTDRQAESPQIANQDTTKPWRRLGERSMPDGIVGAILVATSVTGLLLAFGGWIMFIVSAFKTGPWWGVGVFFGGVTCGIVPLIFFFTHLEECRKAFFCTIGGFALFTLSGAIGVTLEQMQAKAKQKAMIPHHQAASVAHAVAFPLVADR